MPNPIRAALDRAQKLDERRREQIGRQRDSITRLLVALNDAEQFINEHELTDEWEERKLLLLQERQQEESE